MQAHKNACQMEESELAAILIDLQQRESELSNTEQTPDVINERLQLLEQINTAMAFSAAPSSA